MSSRFQSIESWLDDEVFEDQSKLTTSLSKSTSQSKGSDSREEFEVLNAIDQGRNRLNGTSTYCTKEKENKHPKKQKANEQISIDQTLNQLLEEQARINAHSLSIHIN